MIILVNMDVYRSIVVSDSALLQSTKKDVNRQVPGGTIVKQIYLKYYDINVKTLRTS